MLTPFSPLNSFHTLALSDLVQVRHGKGISSKEFGKVSVDDRIITKALALMLAVLAILCVQEHQNSVSCLAVSPVSKPSQTPGTCSLTLIRLQTVVVCLLISVIVIGVIAIIGLYIEMQPPMKYVL